MRILSRLCFLGAGALAGVAPLGSAVADQPNITTAVIAEGTATGLVAGMRAGDTGAAFNSCTVSGSDTTCAVENGNGSSKKIGNILCLPASNASTRYSTRCSTLIQGGSGNCSKNSADGKCSSGTTQIEPVCNYTTSSSDSTTASWVWIVKFASNNTYEVDCMEAGFVGPSQK